MNCTYFRLKISVQQFYMKNDSSQTCGFSSSYAWIWTTCLFELQTKLNAEELMLLNCGVGEDTCETLGQQRDPTSPS